MLAGGTVGYGEAVHRGLQTEKLGAVVVGPILRHSNAGSPSPRLAETTGGLVLQSGLQNRGITAVLKKFAKGWSRLGCPVIAQVADTDPTMLAEVVQRLSDAMMGMGPVDVEIVAIELLIPRSIDEAGLHNTLRVVNNNVDLPLLLKLPLENAATLATVAAEMAVSSVVIGRPMGGAGLAKNHSSMDAALNDNLVVGELFGPLAFAPMMAALHEVAALDLPCTLVASGGIHTVEQAKQVLAAGADALQIDSAAWIEPGLPAFIADQLELLES